MRKDSLLDMDPQKHKGPVPVLVSHNILKFHSF